jgi:hypothetical protein
MLRRSSVVRIAESATDLSALVTNGKVSISAEIAPSAATASFLVGSIVIDGKTPPSGLNSRPLPGS